MESASSEKDVIFEHLMMHIEEWKPIIKSADDLIIRRLSGLSNACYKVTIKPEIDSTQTVIKALLYRRFEQNLTDKRIETSIFKAKSDDGSGPKLFYQGEKYRIESFFEGRPISIWEMRNQQIYIKYAEMICDYNFNESARNKISEFNPIDPYNMFFHQVLKQWAPKLMSNMGEIKKALTESNQ